MNTTSGEGEARCKTSDDSAKCDTDSELTQKASNSDDVSLHKDITSEAESAQAAPTCGAEAPSGLTAVTEATAAGATAQTTSVSNTQGPEEASASPSATQSPAEASASPSGAQGSEEASANTSSTHDGQKDVAAKNEEAEKEKDVDIFGNGLLVKKLISKGKSEDRPNDGDTCTINIDIKLADGTLVDRMEEFSFFLGEHEVMLALDVGVKFMYTGEVSVFHTDAKYAYGSRGRSPDIPANAALDLTVELLRFYPAVERQKLSVDQRLSLGEKKRVRGNQLYSWKDYSTAIEVYSRALYILDPQSGSFTEAPEKLQEFLDCRIKCYNNMCVCQMLLGHHEAAIKSANEVLNVQPDNWKALSRLGKAHGESGNYKKAIEILKRCEKLNADDKLFQSQNQTLMQKYIKNSTKETEKEKKMYKKMFGLEKAETPKVEEKKSTPIFAPSWKWALGGVGMALVAVGVTAAFKYFQH